MTNVATAAPEAPRKMSLACLFSFIFGLLGCIPFLGGALAILLGIIGFIVTGNPAKKGRWMAIVGLLLGLMSVAGWGIFGTGIFAILSLTRAPRVATHDYIQYLSNGDAAGATGHSSGISDEETAGLIAAVKTMGTFKDTTFTSTNINNNDATVAGTADFSGGIMDVEASLHEESNAWKVTGIHVKQQAK